MVGLAVVALAGLWIGYLALSPGARAEIVAGLQYPVPAWMVGIVAMVLLALVVAFVNSRLTPSTSDAEEAEARASALARELMSGFGRGDDSVIWESVGAPRMAQLEYITGLLEQLVESSAVRPHEEAVLFWVDRIRELPEVSYALLDIVSRGRHLEGRQVAILRQTELWPSLQLLRRVGLIAPAATEVSDETVYWLPSDEYEAIKDAIDLVTAPPDEERTRVADVLADVGYELPAGFERFLTA